MSEMRLDGPIDQLFTEALRDDIDRWIAKYPPSQAQSALIPSLHILQAANGGWLSRGIMDALARYLSIPPVRVYEAATFYSMFELAPVGQHTISVCSNISCRLCGAEEIFAHIRQRLGIEPGETTADGRFTLKEVECLGAC